MTQYYISDKDAFRGFVELTYEERLALFGTNETIPYAIKVYRGEIGLEEVPKA